MAFVVFPRSKQFGVTLYGDKALLISLSNPAVMDRDCLCNYACTAEAQYLRGANFVPLSEIRHRLKLNFGYRFEAP
jgi:hypothetical protein